MPRTPEWARRRTLYEWAVERAPDTNEDSDIDTEHFESAADALADVWRTPPVGTQVARLVLIRELWDGGQMQSRSWAQQPFTVFRDSGGRVDETVPQRFRDEWARACTRPKPTTSAGAR